MNIRLYIILNVTTSQYYSGDPEKPWASSEKEAKIFDKLQDAKICNEKLQKTYSKQVIEVRRHVVAVSSVSPSSDGGMSIAVTSGEMNPHSYDAEEALSQVSALSDAVNRLLLVTPNVDELHNALSLLLSETERQLLVLNHLIEFSHANAAEGYNLYKRFREARLLRRRLKDAIMLLNAMKEIAQVTLRDKKNIQDTVALLEDRCYHPRASTPIFAESDPNARETAPAVEGLTTDSMTA